VVEIDGYKSSSREDRGGYHPENKSRPDFTLPGFIKNEVLLSPNS
jgi:hypothetical protein